MKALLRALVIGFGAVIVLLAAAATIGVNNARSIAASSATLVADQLVLTQLLDEVEREQQVLNAAFYRLSRTPEIVDRARVLADLQQTDQGIGRLVAQAKGGPDEAVWNNLHRATLDFSTEARQLLTLKKVPAYSSRDLFSHQQEVTAVVAHLADLIQSRAADTEKRSEQQSARLATESALLLGGCILVALVCAGITVRIAARLFRHMEWQTAELSRVSFRMLETQEATARRFSHELHDELGGALTAIKSNLTAIGASDVAADPAGHARVEDCVKLVEQSISNVRELSQLLRPTILDDFGLDAGLRWLADRFHQRTRIEVEYRSEFDGRLPDETETHLFRIVQEALTNVARHANATRVTIHLRQENGKIRLTFKDNGSGLAAGRQGGMGLTGMRARARSAGGEMTLTSEPGKGVTMEVWAPAAASIERAQSSSEKPAPEKPISQLHA